MCRRWSLGLGLWQSEINEAAWDAGGAGKVGRGRAAGILAARQQAGHCLLVSVDPVEG